MSAGGGYYLQAEGWEGPQTTRIVFKVRRRLMNAMLGSTVSEDSPERFLGFWSAELTGLDPRLLAEQPNGFVVPRFGRVVSAP